MTTIIFLVKLLPPIDNVPFRASVVFNRKITPEDIVLEIKEMVPINNKRNAGKSLDIF